ncbi:MAG: penicillin-binding protein activator LpoB [Nitrospirae bacterium]|nr:MAG: penicillin-binding protein activator LpoB [Nitrospirota bacterium]
MRRLAILALVPLLLAACATSVKRLDVEEIKDVSGRWNDTDSQMVARAMIQDCLSHPWIDQFRRSHGGRQPAIIVGAIRNRSTEHIDTHTFVTDLERAIINSGEATFVAAPGEREQIRSERDAQAGFTEESTRSFHGHETGADYMLLGSVDSIVDKEGRRAVVFYQVNLELIDMRTNRKVWIGDKKIKKYVKRPAARL